MEKLEYYKMFYRNSFILLISIIVLIFLCFEVYFFFNGIDLKNFAAPPKSTIDILVTIASIFIYFIGVYSYVIYSKKTILVVALLVFICFVPYKLLYSFYSWHLLDSLNILCWIAIIILLYLFFKGELS